MVSVQLKQRQKKGFLGCKGRRKASLDAECSMWCPCRDLDIGAGQNILGSSLTSV